jgi:hypothetical protein
MSLWLPCGLHGFAVPNTVTVTAITAIPLLLLLLLLCLVAQVLADALQ